jgi:hypothetical protein
MKTLEKLEQELGPDQIAKLYMELKAKWATAVQDRTIQQKIKELETSQPGIELEKIQHEVLRMLLTELGKVLDPDDYPPLKMSVKSRAEEKYEIAVDGFVRFMGRSKAMTRIVGYFGSRKIAMQHVGKFFYQYGDG